MSTTTQHSHATSHPLAPIETLDSLRTHLQWAIELEHSTIPPYLCALYSLEPERNPDAVEVVTSVFVEEMLHLTLAANLLNAVGGRPVLDAPQLMPGYPTSLPHGDRSFEVSLVPFGREALDLFLRIEQPSHPGDQPEGDDYETIGQFYAAVETGVRGLCSRLGEQAVFTGDPTRQVSSELPYGGAGRIIQVDSLSSALEAFDEIVEQGEGTAHHDVWDRDRDMYHPDRDEVAHFYRFQELALGRRYQRGDTPDSGPTGDPISVDWTAVRPMQRNPSTANHAPGSPIRVAQEAFNQAYCGLLSTLEKTFNGSPQTLGAAVGAMYGLKAQAQALMTMPTEDGLAVAGPTFEYVDPALRR